MSAYAIMNAQVGAKFIGPVRHLTLERVRAFSGGPFAQTQWPDRNLHTDEGKAREAGLAGIIVSGTQFEGHLIDLLITLFGEAWFTAGTIEIKIPKSLMLGETMQPKATLREVREAEGERIFVLDVRCDNPRGEAVMIGTASCRLRAA